VADNDPEKHHFAPRCYIKRWARPDGKVVEFKRRAHGRVEARPTATKGTGYRRNLYTVPGAAPGRQNLVESRYLRRVDTEASLCLDAALGPDAMIPLARRSHWARFVMRMMRGSPDKVAEVEAKARTSSQTQAQLYQAEWEKLRRPEDPESWAEAMEVLGEDGLDGFGARALPKLSDLPRVGEAIVNMKWTIASRAVMPVSFLTSDKPVVTSNGLARPGAFILLPISPNTVFMATRDTETIQNFARQFETGELIEKLNHTVTAQAHEFVYGQSEDAVGFVEERLGQYELKTL